VIEVLEDIVQEREIKLEILTKQTRKALIATGLKDSGIWTNSYYGNQQILVKERSACLSLVLLDDKSPLQPLLRTVFPTKTVEAMVTGIPILVIAPEDTYTARYARASGFAHVVSDIRTETVREAIELLLNDMDLRNCLVQAAWKTVLQNHDARNVAATFRSKVMANVK
jgi:glycosyltransferase involved in cell wall biosynthesis